MASRAHRRESLPTLATLFAGAMLCWSGAALADEPARSSHDSTTWYIVGGPEAAPAGYAERPAPTSPLSRIDVGVTLSRLSPAHAITFSSGGAPGEAADAGHAFLVSGAYDFDTGTLVTPRIVGGLGVSYLGAGYGISPGAGDPTGRQDMAPTAQIGFGADFDLGDTWALSAEYRAMYMGETERPGSLGESRLDQKFTVGAKIRF